MNITGATQEQSSTSQDMTPVAVPSQVKESESDNKNITGLSLNHSLTENQVRLCFFHY